MFDLSTIGKVVEGTYKRGGKTRVDDVRLEVSALVVMPAQFRKTLYLLGTRLDGTSAGNVVLMVAGAFKPDSVKTTPAKAFKAIDLANYVVTPGSDSFAWLEKVTDEDLPWALELGGKPLADFVVKTA